MNIYQKLRFIKNLSVFVKLNILFIVLSIIIILSVIHTSKIRSEIDQNQLQIQLANKMLVYSQQIGLYSELVLREASDSKIELEKTVSLYEKLLVTIRNGGIYHITLDNDVYIEPISNNDKDYISKLENSWLIIKENANILISHETFVGGTEMATGSFDAFGNYNELQVFKPIAPEVKSAIKIIESKIRTFEFQNTELLKYYVEKRNELNSLITIIIIAYLAVFLVVVALGLFIIRFTLIKKLNELLHFSNEIASGNLQESIEVNHDDEIGKIANALSSLKSHLKNAIDFISKIGSGNLSENFEVQGDEDELGKSLMKMKDTMLHASEEDKKRKEQDQIRNWTTQGIAKFGELLRLNNDNINELSYSILSNLIEYIEANVGGIYIIEQEDNKNYIDLVAAYAYDRRKYLSKRLEWGEGLVGRSVLEKKTLFLTEIPDGYISISSGMGFSQPTCIVLTPLINNDVIFGVLELASLKKLENYHIEFIEKISESIASTIATVKINMKTAQLLRESSEQAEQLSQQEEEMRQNMEEMQATQEEAAIRTKAMEGIISAINNSLGSYEINLKGRIVDVNDNFLNILQLNRADIIGLSHVSLLNDTFTEVEYENFWNKIKDGKEQKIEVEYSVGDEKVWLLEAYNIMYDTYGDISKIMVLTTDITKNKKQEAEIQQKLNDIELFQTKLIEKDKEQEVQIAQLKKETEEYIEEIKANEEALNAERQSTMEQVMAKEFELQAEIEKLKKTIKQFENTGTVSVENTEVDNLFDWDDEYSVQYEDIDLQHKELVNLINKLYKDFKSGKAQKDIKQVLKDLIAYSGYHFKTEEKYFVEFNFEDAENHIKEHRDLVNKILDFQKQLESGKVTLSYEIMNFLKQWLIEHILDTDKKYIGKIGDVNSSKPTGTTQNSNNLIEWDDEYSVDIQLIDDQHKILLDLINQFYLAFKEGRAKKQIKTILKGLADYTDYHFGVEENYFKKYNYDKTEEHLALHKIFVKKISEYADDFNSGKVTLSYEIMNFLKDWLLNHILIEDKKYISLFKEKGVK